MLTPPELTTSLARSWLRTKAQAKAALIHDELHQPGTRECSSVDDEKAVPGLLEHLPDCVS